MIAALEVLQPGLHVLVIEALKVHLCEAGSVQISRIHAIFGGKRILRAGGVVDPHVLSRIGLNVEECSLIQHL